MTIKAKHHVDAQGRIVLPTHIRKALNLKSGTSVEVNLDEDGAIRIKVAEEKCSVCGECVEDVSAVFVEDHQVCVHCAMKISQRLRIMKTFDERG